jgi:hypothetical protein
MILRLELNGQKFHKHYMYRYNIPKAQINCLVLVFASQIMNSSVNLEPLFISLL